jgi:hypothetical protein
MAKAGECLPQARRPCPAPMGLKTSGPFHWWGTAIRIAIPKPLRSHLDATGVGLLRWLRPQQTDEPEVRGAAGGLVEKIDADTDPVKGLPETDVKTEFQTHLLLMEDVRKLDGDGSVFGYFGRAPVPRQEEGEIIATLVTGPQANRHHASPSGGQGEGEPPHRLPTRPEGTHQLPPHRSPRV